MRRTGQAKQGFDLGPDYGYGDGNDEFDDYDDDDDHESWFMMMIKSKI